MNDIKKFEILLKDIGYEDESPIYTKENKRKKQSVYKCSSGGMAIYSYIIPYFNKKSYVYLEFLDNYNILEENELKIKIKTLCKNIRFEEKTRIGEIGWEVIYTKTPDQFTLKERTSIFFSFLRSSSKTLKGQFNLKPQKGDILAAKPHGPKINQGFTESSMEIGLKQRILLGKKFNFGDIKEDGFQYAIYDEQGNLHPI
jgi:hypothetical protein